MSVDVAVAAARALAESWLAEANQRRRISKHDPVVEALEYCAAELSETVRGLDAPGAMRTVEQFAAEMCVTGSAVRRWIAAGRLEATLTPHGYRIQRNAQVRKRERKTA